MKKLVALLCFSADKWWYWALIIGVCVGLEAWALYFQVVLEYYPCELCIYTRVWLTGMALVAALGLWLHRYTVTRRILLAIQLLLAGCLAYITWRLLGVDYGFGPASTCGVATIFPSWARLDEWWPLVFQIQDSCQATPIVVWKLSMADGLTGVSLGFLTVYTCSIIGDFRK